MKYKKSGKFIEEWGIPVVGTIEVKLPLVWSPFESFEKTLIKNFESMGIFAFFSILIMFFMVIFNGVIQKLTFYNKIIFKNFINKVKLIVSNFNSNDSSCKEVCSGDVNNDGVINAFDFSLCVKQQGVGCGGG